MPRRWRLARRDLRPPFAAHAAPIARSGSTARRSPAASRRDVIEPIYGKTYLPRKFKIAVAVPPSNDVDVFAHDLGFIAILDSNERRRRLQRHRRRRHGHDPWRARHLSAHRRRDGLLQARGRDRGRRGGRHRAARLGRPLRPQARAAQIHHRGSRARCLPRRGRAPQRREARQAASLTLSPRPATATAGPKARTAAAISRCSSRTAASRTRAARANDRPGLRRIAEHSRRRFPPHAEPERHHRQRRARKSQARSRRSSRSTD